MTKPSAREMEATCTIQASKGHNFVNTSVDERIVTLAQESKCSNSQMYHEEITCY